MSASPNRALVVVCTSVLLASSTWFSGTAALPSLAAAWDLSAAQGAWLTMSVQLGFIVGTFLYSLLNLADVFNARRVFFASALAGAGFNAAFAFGADSLGVGLALRFCTGVTLAGVYPVGMKIVASWFRTGLGWRLGVMVGALTLGTASPFLLRTVAADLGWRDVVALASGLAVVGGTLMLVAVGDGPHLRGRASFNARMLVRVFEDKRFRYTAFGYFGHMWELYAFWSLVSFFLGASLADDGPAWTDRVPLLAFITIGVGAIGCAGGGWISRRVGERRVALVSLIASATLCATSGFAYDLPPPLLLAFVLLWGLVVVSDSPQFSALAARYCPPEYTGTALTVQNGIGFAITLASIQLVPIVAAHTTWRWAFAILTIGPLLGAHFTRRL